MHLRIIRSFATLCVTGKSKQAKRLNRDWFLSNQVISTPVDTHFDLFLPLIDPISITYICYLCWSFVYLRISLIVSKPTKSKLEYVINAYSFLSIYYFLTLIIYLSISICSLATSIYYNLFLIYHLFHFFLSIKICLLSVYFGFHLSIFCNFPLSISVSLI